MTTDRTTTITRRGFRNFRGTAAQKAKAECLVRDAATEGPVLAELRLATYCGDDSAGAQGAAMLSLHTVRGFDLRVIY